MASKSPELTPYEALVQKNIEENRRVLQSLGLLDSVKEPILHKPKKAKPSKPKTSSSSTAFVDFSPSKKRITRRSSTLLENGELTCLEESDEEYRPTPKSKKIIQEQVFGEIEGVSVGDWWLTRMECSAAGVHRPTVAGISGRNNEGCFSIALSGGYADDQDCGEYFTYTGCGGRDLKGTKSNPKNLRTAPQTKDQVFDGMNAALALNIENKKPVRVIRGYKLPSPYAPDEGYRYDGLYSVEKAWTATGLSGFKVCKFALKRLGNQDPPPWTLEDLETSPTDPNGSPTENRTKKRQRSETPETPKRQDVTRTLDGVKESMVCSENGNKSEKITKRLKLGSPGTMNLKENGENSSDEGSVEDSSCLSAANDRQTKRLRSSSPKVSQMLAKTASNGSLEGSLNEGENLNTKESLCRPLELVNGRKSVLKRNRSVSPNMNTISDEKDRSDIWKFDRPKRPRSASPKMPTIQDNSNVNGSSDGRDCITNDCRSHNSVKRKRSASPNFLKVSEHSIGNGESQDRFDVLGDGCISSNITKRPRSASPKVVTSHDHSKPNGVLVEKHNVGDSLDDNRSNNISKRLRSQSPKIFEVVPDLNVLRVQTSSPISEKDKPKIVSFSPKVVCKDDSGLLSETSIVSDEEDRSDTTSQFSDGKRQTSILQYFSPVKQTSEKKPCISNIRLRSNRHFLFSSSVGAPQSTVTNSSNSSNVNTFDEGKKGLQKRKHFEGKRYFDERLTLSNASSAVLDNLIKENLDQLENTTSGKTLNQSIMSKVQENKKKLQEIERRNQYAKKYASPIGSKYSKGFVAKDEKKRKGRKEKKTPQRSSMNSSQKTSPVKPCFVKVFRLDDSQELDEELTKFRGWDYCDSLMFHGFSEELVNHVNDKKSKVEDLVKAMMEKLSENSR